MAAPLRGVGTDVLGARAAGAAGAWRAAGAGFGPAGEGYFRLSAFNSRANIEEAIGRIRRVFGGR